MMDFSNPGRSARSWAGAFLTLLAFGFVVPGAASAGCPSHYVPTLSSSNGLGIGVEALDNAGEMAVADAAGIPGRPRPCTGEMCSGRPAIPLAPAPAEIRFVGSWAILTVVTRIEPPVRAETLLDDEDIRPALGPSSIFHPPRLSDTSIPAEIP
jgi:hypothetical protein